MSNQTQEISPSDFTRRVTMSSYTFDQGNTGGTSAVLTESFDCWAQVISKGGSQYVTQAQTKNDAQFQVTIRYRSQVTENWNVTYEGQRMIINRLSYDNNGYKRYIIMQCSESINQESWS